MSKRKQSHPSSILNWFFAFAIGFCFVRDLPAQQDLIDFGKSLLRDGKFEEAKILFDAVALNYPEPNWQRPAKLGIAKALLGLGDTASSVKILENLSEGIDNEALNALLTLASLNDSNLVAEANFRVAERFPEIENRKERLLLSYKTFRSFGNLNAAGKVLKVISSDYSSLKKWAQLELADLYLKKKNFVKVIQIAIRYPDEDRAQLLKAQVYLLQGDTLSAIEALSNSRTLPNLKLLAEIHQKLVNFDAVLRTLSRFPDSLPEISQLKANAMLRLGMEAQLEDIIPYIKDTLFKANIYLSLGYPDSALKVLSMVQDAPDSLLVKAYLQANDIFSAWSVWKRSSLPPILSRRIANRLDSLGYHELAVKVWRNLWNNRPSGEQWIPLDQIGTRLARDLFITGDTASLRGILDTLKLVGITPILIPPRSKVNEIIKQIARGTPLKEGVRGLLQIHAYKDAIDLLEGLKLDSTGMELLGRAYLFAFKDGDSVSALKLDQLFKRGLNNIALFVQFYKKFNPKLVIDIEPDKLPRRFLKGYVEALISLNQPDSALKIIKRFGIFDNKLLFDLYLQMGFVDSAYKHLDFTDPMQTYTLAEKLFEKEAYDLSIELLDRVNLPGFLIDKQAKELALKAAIELGDEERILKFVDEIERNYGKDSLTINAKALVMVKKDPQWVALRLYTQKDPESMKLKARALFNSGHKVWAFRYADFDSKIKFIKALRDSDVVTLLELPVPQEPSIILDYLRLLWEKDHGNIASILADSAIARGLISKDAVLRVKGESMLNKGDIESALTQIDFINDPEEKARLFYNIGIQLMKKGNFEKAKSMFFKAIQWGDAETRGYGAFKLATTLFQEKRYEESAEYYLMALELVQSDTLLRLNALHNLAVCYKQMDKADKALEAYHRIISDYPGSEESLDAFISKGLLLIDKGKPKEAYESFSAVEGELNSVDVEVELQFWMGQAAAMQGEYIDALSHYKRLYLFHPKAGQWSTTSKLEAAKIFAMLGDQEGALNIYTQLLNTVSKEDPLYSEIEKAIEQLKSRSK